MRSEPAMPGCRSLVSPRGSIVRRLRLSLLGVAVLMGMAMITGLTGFLSANRYHDALVNHTLPHLIKAEALSRNLSETAAIAAKIVAAEDVAALGQLRQDLTARLVRIGQLIDAEIWQQRQLEARAALRRELDRFSTSAITLIDRQQDIFAIEATLARHVAALVDIHQHIGVVSKSLMASSTITLGGQMRSLEGNGRLNAAELPALRGALNDFSRFNQVLGDMETALALSVGLGDPARNRDEGDLLRRARLSTRSAAQLLASLPPGEMRANLFSINDKLQQTLSGPTGMEGILKARRTTREQGRILGLENAASIAALGEMSVQMVADANREIEHAQAELGAINLRTGLLAGIAFILAFILIAGLFVFVVERQINRRVEALARAVRHIADGDVDYPVEVNGPDELGKIADALAVFKRNAQELQRSNGDLRTFAYVASHDLRSPLRAIRDLATWTIEDAGDALPPDCRENLDLMLSRVDRMSRLLADLLDYAQAGNVEASSAQLDLAERVAHLGDLVDPTGKFTIHVDAGPDELATHITPLDQILLNLLTNAIKHHDKPHGQIWVKATSLNRRIHITVRDDGPGIPGKYHDRIFELFQTLKSRDQVEGSGLGLAIVVRLVGLYGGKIFVASDPNTERGATFGFDVPNTMQSVAEQAA